MSLEEMKHNVRRRLEEQHLPAEVITGAVNNVRFLNRWLQQPEKRLPVNRPVPACVVEVAKWHTS
jgi:hypothetical protein